MALGKDARSSVGGYVFLCELEGNPLGAVWAARDADDPDRTVAIRRVTTRPPVTQRAAKSLEDAARWAVGREHPTVVSTLGVATAGSELALVSALIEGEPLAALLAPARERGEPVKAPIALRIALDVLEALAFVHQQEPHGKPDVRFGGVCPDAIVVGLDGRARLRDLGSAAIAGGTIPWSGDVERVAYRAPESVKLTAVLDGRSDVFSVGVLLWEMLSAKRLFEGKNRMAVQQAVRRGAIPPLTGASSAVSALIAQALEREPEARLESVEALREAIEATGELAPMEVVAAWVQEAAGSGIDARTAAIEEARGRVPEQVTHEPDEEPEPRAAIRAPAIKPPKPASEASPPPARVSPPPRRALARRGPPLKARPKPPPPKPRAEVLSGEPVQDSEPPVDEDLGVDIDLGSLPPSAPADSVPERSPSPQDLPKIADDEGDPQPTAIMEPDELLKMTEQDREDAAEARRRAKEELDRALADDGNDTADPAEEPDEEEPGERELDEKAPDESEPDESEPDESEPDESEPDESEPDESEPDEAPSGEAAEKEAKADRESDAGEAPPAAPADAEEPEEKAAAKAPSKPPEKRPSRKPAKKPAAKPADGERARSAEVATADDASAEPPGRRNMMLLAAGVIGLLVIGVWAMSGDESASTAPAAQQPAAQQPAAQPGPQPTPAQGEPTLADTAPTEPAASTAAAEEEADGAAEETEAQAETAPSAAPVAAAPRPAPLARPRPAPQPRRRTPAPTPKPQPKFTPTDI